jgi:transposase
VPSAADEAARHVSRERRDLVAQRTRLINQMRGWLMTVGATLPTRRRDGWWHAVRDWAGVALSLPLQARLARADGRLGQVDAQLREIAVVQQEAITAAAPGTAAQRLVALKGLGVTSVSTLLEEGLVWRAFRNRREIGGLLGFAPTHFASGAVARDRGISHAGNRRLQAVMIEAAWNWVRWQPTSALTQWYRQRFVGKRARRIGIVAVARKLLIAFWRCATTGQVPAGALLKAA